jgi:hypothetical protein
MDEKKEKSSIINRKRAKCDVSNGLSECLVGGCNGNVL